LEVALPAAAAGGDSGFAAVGRALVGGASAASAPLPGTDAGDVSQALPLPPEQAFGFEAIADGADGLLLRFTPARGYYLYRDRSSFRIDDPAGIVAGTPRWPRGVAHNDGYFGDVTVYFDQVDVPLPLRRGSGEAATVRLVATFQGCQDDGICYPPMTRTVEVALPEAVLQGSESLSPVGIDAPAAPGGESDSDPDPAGPVPLPDASADNAARTPPPGSTLPKGGALGALLLALLGGLVLNLMPCVLPILSLKVLGLAQSGGSRAHARRHALWYTAGVLVSFAAIGALVLALRAAGQALGWGFQLQQPWFVAALVYLMFAVGLALSGVFTLGGGLGNLGQSLASRSGPAGDFFTGVLACVVASPCIAPFMGGALAFAFTASPWLAMAVFLMLGLGLALPFLLIGLVPALADRLPKPGAWMETFKQ